MATLLLAVGASWSVGNVGAVVGDLSGEFDLSLATVGLISGTLLLGFSVPGTLLAPLIGERRGIARTMVAAVLLGAAGSVLFALSPGIGGLLAGRAATGFALGVIVVVGPVFARATGGVGRVALFGAGIQLGIAGGLGAGAALADAARVLGGRLAERDFSRVLLVSGAPFLAAVGLVILALDDSLGFALLAVIACGVGFAVPYGIGVVQAQSLYPTEPTEPVAFVTLVGTAVPIPLVPLIGSLLDDGYGPEVFLGLAAIVTLAGVLNLRPVAGSLEPEAAPART